MLRRIIHREFHPAQVLVASFAFAILAGTVLLKLPAVVNGEALSLVDALFTATSAVCVTGLIVVDTATKFTGAGHVIILFLIQVGGLGIMTFSVIFVVMAGKRISFRERIMIQDSFAHAPVKDLRSLVTSIVMMTFIMEAVGALLLFVCWYKDFPLGTALFTSLFHAVSAFCNAGFSLFPDSLMRYREHAGVNLTVASLIIVGGLGFLVVMDVRRFILKGDGERKTLSLHSRIVLVTSLLLIIIGMALFFLIERDNVLKGSGMGTAIMASFFQSVTARTAGFNTIDIGLLTPEVLFLIILLMFIGASPGSTGGGVKTTTIGVLAALVRSRYAGREEVSIFKRTIPKDVVARALSILVSSVIVVILFVMILLIAEKGGLDVLERRERFIEILFEAVSAFGTVGLSTGVTPTLSDTGKLAVAALMFIGRLGPLTIALAIGKKFAEGKFRYSEERVMTG